MNQTFIFNGRSGCGKGTQAKFLESFLKNKDTDTPVYYLETGKAFRDFIAGPSHSSALSKEIYDKGGLQPEFLAVYMWSSQLIKDITGKEHLIIDGSPRKIIETHLVDSAMKFYGRIKPNFIYINVSREWSKARLLGRGRSDDKKDDIETRLNWFDTDVVPAIDFFRNNPDYNFIEINGEQTIEEVNKEMMTKLGLFL